VQSYCFSGPVPDVSWAGLGGVSHWSPEQSGRTAGLVDTVAVLWPVVCGEVFELPPQLARTVASTARAIAMGTVGLIRAIDFAVWALSVRSTSTERFSQVAPVSGLLIIGMPAGP